MKRILSGSLTHLAPPALMRLLSATATSGVLELVTDEGSFRMEIDHGWTAVPPTDQLDAASRVLTCSEGAFRFEPGDVSPVEGPSLSLGAFADAVRSGLRDLESGQLTDIEVDRLVSGEIVELAQSATLPNIHLLPPEPPVNPLDDLLEGLAEAPDLEPVLFKIGRSSPIWVRGEKGVWPSRGYRHAPLLLPLLEQSPFSPTRVAFVLILGQGELLDTEELIQSRWWNHVIRFHSKFSSDGLRWLAHEPKASNAQDLIVLWKQAIRETSQKTSASGLLAGPTRNGKLPK